MKRVTYYGIAENAKGKIEAVLVTCANQKMISQEWTGVTYRTRKEAYEEIGKLNELVAKAIQRETEPYVRSDGKAVEISIPVDER